MMDDFPSGFTAPDHAVADDEPDYPAVINQRLLLHFESCHGPYCTRLAGKKQGDTLLSQSVPISLIAVGLELYYVRSLLTLGTFFDLELDFLSLG